MSVGVRERGRMSGRVARFLSRYWGGVRCFPSAAPLFGGGVAFLKGLVCYGWRT